MPNHLMIEGHTDSKPFAASGDYGNWELSSDRANAARRVMLKSGIRDDQIIQVRGFADRSLRKPKEPEDPSNRRVSVIVQYQSAPEVKATPEHGKAEHGKPEPDHGKSESPKAEHAKP